MFDAWVGRLVGARWSAPLLRSRDELDDCGVMSVMHRFRRSFPVLLAALATVVLPAGTALAATAAKVPPGMPPKGKVLLGMGGHQTTMAGFDSLTRAEHAMLIELLSKVAGR